MCKDIHIVYRTEIKDMAQLGTASDNLLKTIQDFRLLLGEGNTRGNWRERLAQNAVRKGFENLQEKIAFMSQVVKLALGRSQTLDSIFERLEAIKFSLPA